MLSGFAATAAGQIAAENFAAEAAENRFTVLYRHVKGMLIVISGGHQKRGILYGIAVIPGNRVQSVNKGFGLGGQSPEIQRGGYYERVTPAVQRIDFLHDILNNASIAHLTGAAAPTAVKITLAEEYLSHIMPCSPCALYK